MTKKELAVRDTLVRIRAAVEFELARTTNPPHGLTFWDALKWLTYQQYKLQAIDTVREELVRLNEEIKRTKKGKGKCITVGTVKGVNRHKYLTELVEERDMWLRHSLEDERAEYDRDEYYDEEAWTLGKNLDPDFHTPIISWAPFNAEGI